MKNKILSLILILSLVLCSFASVSTVFASGSEIDELESKKSAVQSQISSIKNDISKQNELKSALQQEIDILQQQIDIYNGQIIEFNAKIQKLEDEKSVIVKDLNSKKKTFLERIRAMYISGSTNSDLLVLLGSESFGTYLYQSELLDRVTESDNIMLNELKKDIAKIDSIESEVKVEKNKILPLQNNVQSKQNELNDIMKEYNVAISNLQGQQNELEFSIEEYNAKISEIEEDIRNRSNSGNGSGGGGGNTYSSDGTFIWPCPGYDMVSSEFGYRWGTNHNGIDIAGNSIYGQPIVAAADGYVSISSSDYGGYGQFVLINHGNSYSTAYGHMSQRAVYEGQSVSAGQVIGYVGSTGWSTGPHLHFEIRINGTAYDPLGWF